MTLKIPSAIREKLQVYSKHKGVSKSEIVRSALLDYFERDELEKQGTFYDLSKYLAGSINGPVDLSTNKDHFSGFGK